jgi:hypothetical protein
MTAFDPSNVIFQLAASFINQTNRHLFLTGKAGTGKTTFLKYIKEHSSKKLAVVAPTGVAAINAGGVTIHSLFQIPPGMYLPSSQTMFESLDGTWYNHQNLIKQMRMSREKKELLRELDLLIIDEVSMVRADLLDAIDTVLRFTRRQPHIAFGGVQVLYIGDLFQLPPVVLNDEWEWMKDFYRSPFFFDALVIQKMPPIYIELKKIYRQSDDVFISILNNIRNNCCTKADLDLLHNHYMPGFSSSPEEHFITLTTHNEKAIAINNQELKKLPGRVYQFKAEINRDFNEHSYPVQELLQLKKGAQVMLIKNDTGEFRRYYNGKIGSVHSIDDKKIQLTFPAETELLSLEKETWKNVRYYYHSEKDKIEEQELGTFTQYPVRLAWAITIHKSQGLTFDKAIIDGGASFAAGQVYVALSRLTSLNGLVLKSCITPNSIHTDDRVLEFVLNELSEDALRQILRKEQQYYVRDLLIRGFSWKNILDLLHDHLESDVSRNIPNIDTCITWAQELTQAVKALEVTALKFQKQLTQLFEYNEQGDYKQSHERVSAACNYFIKETDDKLLRSLYNQIETYKIKRKTRKYVNELYALTHQFERKKVQLQNILNISNSLSEPGNNVSMFQLTDALHKSFTTGTGGEKLRRKKVEKGETKRISLLLFRKGKSIAEIAKERGLAYSTIEAHLVGFIATGEINILDIIDGIKLEKITGLLEKNPSYSASEIKQQLGNDFSYGQIKAVISFKALSSASF